MILLKPVFVNHNGDPIYCVDLHPQGMKFVTGGFSSGGGRLIIWNVFPVVERNAEVNDNVPRKLYEIDSVNCVYCARWSNSGDFLASGGLGEVVLIWKKEDSIEGQQLFKKETWKCVHTLSGHSGGVLDLAWSPQDALIASAGADKSIIVWSIKKSPEILARLHGHEGRVKGVTWDPVGMYLASQSDDRTCRIWRTSDWKEQIQISEPFRESRSKTHFLRLSWSPDGQYLVTTNAKNSGQHTASIIEINGRPIKDEGESWSCEMDFVGHTREVTCVRFNNALFKKRGVKTKHCVLATGSRDSTVAVWSTVQRGPIVVIRNLFSKSVVDLAWGPNGLLLIACSADGTVGVMVFKELGQVISMEDQVTTLESMYGKSYFSQLLNLPKVVVYNENKLEVNNEKESSIPTIAVAETQKLGPGSPATATVTPEQKKSQTDGNSSVEKELLAKQIETRLPDGKRRITPITVGRSGMGSQTFSSSSDSKTKIIVERREIVEKPVIVSSDESEKSPLKRKEPSSPQISSKACKGLLIPFELPRTKIPREEKMKPCHEFRPSEPIYSRLSLPDTTVEPIISLPKNFIEIINNMPQFRYVVRRIDRTRAYVDRKWEINVGSRVNVVRATDKWTVVVTDVKVLLVLSTPCGRYFKCPILLPYDPAHVILTETQFLCVINTLGHIAVWDLSTRRLVMFDEELRFHLFADGVVYNVVYCDVYPDGTPVVCLSNGSTICYCKNSGWLLICDTASHIWQIFQAHQLIKKERLQFEPLRAAINESKWACKYSLGRMTLSENIPYTVCASNALLILLKSAETLKSVVEFKNFFLDLVRLFVEDGRTMELEILLEQITSSEEQILRMNKSELLQEVSLFLARYPSCDYLQKKIVSAS